MPRKPRVVVAAEDPGAANVLAPVAGRLRGEGCVDLAVWGLLQARPVFRRAGVLPAPGLRRDSMIRRFRSDPPDLLLVGSSEAPDSLDRRLTLLARERGVPVLSILDFWSNYITRYSGPLPSERLRFLPDLIFTMDARARRDMIRLGIPPRRIRVVGHPHLEGFVGPDRRVGRRRRHEIRQSLGLRPGEKFLCFASETYGWKYDRPTRFRPLSGSRDRTEIVLEHLLGAVEGLSRTHRLRPFVLNKLHPKNRPSEFLWLRRRRLSFPVRSVRGADNDALVQAADLVVGMTTMFLTEATYLGARVLHIVPRREEERLLQDVARHNPIARNPRELRRELRRLLVRPPPPNAPVLRRFARRHRGATGRIVRGIYDILGARNAFTKKKA
jgi:hypothetical protein